LELKMLVKRLVIVAAAGALLAACASGTGTLPGAQTAANSVSPASKHQAALTIRIRIPKTRHHRGKAPRYISAATQGMTMAFTGPSTFTQVINLTPSDPRCSGSPLTCTIDVALKAGSYTATVKTYDRAPVSGAIPVGANLLSTARNVAFTITAGIANHVGITLDGVPASITVGGFPSASAGTAFLNKSFSVTVKDADGYLIVGTYSTPIMLTDSDTSGATTIATAGSDTPPADELLSSSDTATISYTGRAITPVTIDASAGTVSGSGIFAVQLPVFVADSDKDAVDEIPPGCTTAACVATLGGGFSDPFGVAVDASGNVFVGDTLNNAVKEIPPGCTTAGCVTSLGGGFDRPLGVAVDGSGNVFVGDAGNNAVKEILSGCSSAGCVVTLGGGFSVPVGVATDSSGNVFVADSGNNAVKEIPTGCFDAACVTTVLSGVNGPYGVAVNGSDDVFVAEASKSTVKEILPDCTRFCVVVLDGDFSSPEGVAIDGSGNLFVGDTGNSVVKEFPAGCSTIDCATTLGAGFDTPAGVAVL
jgi:NHL repeat